MEKILFLGASIIGLFYVMFYIPYRKAKKKEEKERIESEKIMKEIQAKNMYLRNNPPPSNYRSC